MTGTTGPTVEERAVLLTVNGSAMHEWRCTPTDLEALAIGRLRIEGLIVAADDVHLVIEENDRAMIIAARLIEPRTIREQVPGALPIPNGEVFTTMFRELFATVEARHENGGMHTAAICNAGGIVLQVEDVGRHNAIDKAVGMTLLSSRACDSHGLLISSRVSGEIAHKAVHAGFAWLASRSIPTTLAVEIAANGHMPIIGRAASKNAHIYA
jgi:FdhD protein